MTTLRRCSVVVLIVALLVAAACGGGDDDDSGGGGGGGGGGSDLASQCPIGAIDELDASAKPVEITYWHSFPEENERLITELTDEFNASQDDVTVKLVNQTSYGDTLTAFRAGLRQGRLCPTSCMLEDKETQQMIDSDAVVPAQACIDADDYDMSDFLDARHRLLHGRGHAVADAVQRVEPGPLLQQGARSPRPVSTPSSRRRRSTRSRRRPRRSSMPESRRTVGR